LNEFELAQLREYVILKSHADTPLISSTLRTAFERSFFTLYFFIKSVIIKFIFFPFSYLYVSDLLSHREHRQQNGALGQSEALDAQEGANDDEETNDASAEDTYAAKEAPNGNDYGIEQVCIFSFF
jgi:hypothetical protein